MVQFLRNLGGFTGAVVECWAESPRSVTVCQSCLNVQVGLNYADVLLGYASESQLWDFYMMF